MKTPETSPPRIRRVLLAEPESAGETSPAPALEGFGYEVVVERSESGAEARLRSDPLIGLALLDVDLDGDGACARLAASIPEFRDLPVVFLDAKPGNAASERVRSVPRYGYVSRNAAPFILRSVLETAFDLFEARNRLSERNRILDKINDYALRLDGIPLESIYRFALENAVDIFKARISAANSYDEAGRVLILEDFASSEDESRTLIGAVGRRMLGMRTPVSEANYRRMVIERVGVVSSIHEMSFGKVPGTVSNILQQSLRADWFRGVALLSEGQLYGTLILVGQESRPPPEPDELLAFAEITASTLKRKAAEQRIRHLLSEKDLLLHEVHHRIKNNMATVIGLLDLQSESVADEAAAEALREAKSRLQSMGTLYEKLYRTENLREMPLGEYIPDLAAEIVGMFPKGGFVRIETRIEEFNLPVKTVSVLGIILNELLTNAMKYAFRDREMGHIRITAARKGRRVAVEVRDDGAGLPVSLDPFKTSSFGLRLVRVLTDQLGGSVRFESKGGTAVFLDLPYPGR
ncbi:MAG TPA: histidine kinase dimerization/phosphoacceptor domain -containing protein [Spirochaetia bacterium]|nr:histidine kinase dimerization/phosphoacceptor domain -containing protein [Spirochaetia bacterium]